MPNTLHSHESDYPVLESCYGPGNGEGKGWEGPTIMIVTRKTMSWKRDAMMIALLTTLTGILIIIITRGTWVPTNNHILRTFVVSHGGLAVDSSLQRAYVMPYEDGAISTFDTAQGTLVRTTTLATGPIGYVPLVGIDAVDGRFFMPQPTRPNAWGGNVIDILDARMGLLRGSTTLPVRAPILQLAVDASTKRVFVVTTMTLPPTSAAYVCVIGAPFRRGAAGSSRRAGQPHAGLVLQLVRPRVPARARGVGWRRRRARRPSARQRLRADGGRACADCDLARLWPASSPARPATRRQPQARP